MNKEGGDEDRASTVLEVNVDHTPQELGILVHEMQPDNANQYLFVYLT